MSPFVLTCWSVCVTLCVVSSALQYISGESNRNCYVAVILAYMYFLVALPTHPFKVALNLTPVFPVSATATPDTASFQYDETSGYYYDSTTSLYYDANSQYFYNPANQRYLYWDAAKSKYVPMPSDGEASASGSGKKKEDKHEKVKVAKKIAKVREFHLRWLSKRRNGSAHLD